METSVFHWHQDYRNKVMKSHWRLEMLFRQCSKALAVNASLLARTKEAVQNAEVVFLATPFGANQAIIEGLQTELEGKIVVDCTNPVGSGFTHGLNNEQSEADSFSRWFQIAT